MSALSESLRAEAERQAREGLCPGPFKPTCIECQKPFAFGSVDSGANVYSMAGARESQITEMCELCFDEMAGDLDGADFDDDTEGGAS